MKTFTSITLGILLAGCSTLSPVQTHYIPYVKSQVLKASANELSNDSASVTFAK